MSIWLWKRKAVRNHFAARGDAILSVSQHSENTFRKVFIDLSMPWNGLRDFGGRIVIPIVLPAVSDQYTAIGFELSDKIFALH
jgi:hypothetical protein